MKHTALQDLAAPAGVCYGCGGKNPHRLHVKSYWHADGAHVEVTHMPDSK
jgi:hypothetical protein